MAAQTSDLITFPADGGTHPADRISVHGITGFGHHGVLGFERELGQPFVVDVDCAVDLAAAGASDDLNDTIDYGGLARQVVADIERDPLDLIEALADRIASTLLVDVRVASVSVTVHKPQAPMPVPVADTAVTVVRRQRARPASVPERSYSPAAPADRRRDPP